MSQMHPRPLEDGPFRRRAVLLIWLAAALLAAGVSPYWRINPDSALYVGIAESISRGDGYVFSGEPQASIPPLVPHYLSLAHRLADAIEPSRGRLETFVYYNAFTALAGMAGIAGGFLLALEIAGRRRALVVLLLLATSHRYFSHAIVPVTDIVYAALSVWALYFLVRARRRGSALDLASGAIVLALAPAARLVGLALVLAVALDAAWRLRRGGGVGRRFETAQLLAAVPGALVGATLIYRVIANRSSAAFNYWDDLAAGRSAGEILHRFGYDLWTFPGNLFDAVVSLDSAWGLGVAFTALVAAGWLRRTRAGERLAGIYFVCYFIFVAAGEEILPRYVAPLLPLVYLYLADGVAAAAGWTAARSSSPAARMRMRRAVKGLTAAVIAVNLFYTAREIGRNFGDDFYALHRRGRWRDYIALAADLELKAPRGRTMTYRPRVLNILAGVGTAGLPYHVETRHRPDSAEIGRFVKDRDIEAIVIDLDEEESARMLSAYMESSEEEWVDEGRYGRLVIYVRWRPAALPEREWPAEPT